MREEIGGPENTPLKLHANTNGLSESANV